MKLLLEWQMNTQILSMCIQIQEKGEMKGKQVNRRAESKRDGKTTEH